MPRESTKWTPGRGSPLHAGLGLLAVLAIAAITVLVPSWNRLRLPALVR